MRALDNGTGGDATAGDNVFSRSVTVASGTTAGGKSLPVTVSDAQGRSGSGAISLTVQGQQSFARQFVPIDQGLSVTFFGGAPAGLGNPFFLGGRSDGAPFDGALARFGLWDEALTGTEITALQTQSPNAVNAAALTAYIPLDADTNEHIVGITPTQTGTINTITGRP